MNENTKIASLDDILLQSGANFDTASLSSLIEGVAAAPTAATKDEWMTLVSDDLSDSVKTDLQAHLKQAQLVDAGLDGELTQPDRIASVRAELERMQVDGFIIPRCDAHQGEYVSLNAERLAWLTGFTGSAGMAVVLKEKAAIFVDGRYTLQARNQVSNSIFEICPMSDCPATTWISKNITKGAKIAYDPWLLTPAQVARYQAACSQAGATLVSAEHNLLDRAWHNRPADPISPISPHLDTFSGQLSAEKRLAIGNQLSDQGIDAAFLSAPDSIAWLLNIRGGDVPYTPFALSFAVLNADGTADWFVDERKLTSGVKNHLGNGITVRPVDELGDALQVLGARSANVRLSPSDHPDWVFKKLESAGGCINRGPDPCQLIKAAKNETEVSGIRNAHLRDGKAVCRFLAWIDQNAPRGSLSELEASDQLEVFRKENDLFRGLSFPTISGSGPNGAIVHYRVTEKSNRPLDQDSLFLVDSGAQYLDGTTDITRTMAIGTPSAEMRRNFTRVLKGHIALAKARFPQGTTGSQLDILARAPLWNAGLDYDHGTGHGVGAHLSVHEGPQRISKMPSTIALQAGMVISNEPGYYKEGAYGIRIENLVCVRSVEDMPDAERQMLEFETLTFAPIDKRLIDTDLLSKPEMDWIDAYHSDVFKKIGPQLKGDELAWLTQATSSLTS